MLRYNPIVYLLVEIRTAAGPSSAVQRVLSGGPYTISLQALIGEHFPIPGPTP